MVRTIDEMEKSNALDTNNLSDVLAYSIVAGDFLRARRRRFALNIISSKINGDGFMQEKPFVWSFLSLWAYIRDGNHLFHIRLLQGVRR